MKRSLLSIILLAFIMVGFAQEVQEIEKPAFRSATFATDRGVFNKSGATFGRGLQLELGTGYEWVQDVNSAYKTDLVTPFAVQARLGLSDYVELDFAIANQELINRYWNAGKDKYNYWTPMQIGIRAQFLDGQCKKVKTDGSIFINFRVNSTQRDAYDDDGNLRPWVIAPRPNFVAPEFALLFSHEFGGRFVLGYNGGVRWMDDGKRPDIYYTVSALVHVAKKFDVYAEHYNYMRKDEEPNVGFNAGIRLALTQKIMFDFNGGAGLNATSSLGFLGAGFTFNLSDKR